MRVRLRRLHSRRLRSVNGKHAPFVRPRCGFDSCRRLSRTPVAQRKSAAPCDAAEDRCVRRPAGACIRRARSISRASADVAQTEEHRSATPGRPVRSGSSASKACGVTAARRAPTSLVRVRILAGLLHHDRRGPERLGYLVRAVARSAPLRFDSASRPHPTTATYFTCCGPERFRLSTPNRQVAGSSPARSTRAPVAQLVEQFRAVTPRPQQSHLTAGRRGRLSHPESRRPDLRPAMPGLHPVSHHDRGDPLRVEERRTSYLLQYARRSTQLVATPTRSRRRATRLLNRARLLRRRVRPRLRRGHLDGARRGDRRCRQPRCSCCRSPTARTRSTSSSRSSRPSCARTRSSRSTRCSARSTASATASPRRPSSPRGVTQPTDTTKGGARCRT